ncbi:MAG: N-acetylneuraminate synthase family protein [Armatimonadetes bacterium]|nr:N-acetylneuraminate synthase family protein [Armatimonadota bacterium]
MTNTTPYIQIGDRRVGPGEPTYIIAEAGINHNGNPETARKLIEVAVEAGVDAIKFQKRDLRCQYAPELFSDLADADKELQYLIPFLEQAELPDHVVRNLAEEARQQGLEFLCTPWDEASVDFLESLDMPAYKISSPDLTNLFLLEHAVATGKPLIISTGMSRWEEIVATVQFLKDRDVEFALLHCQSTYPAAFRDIHLRAMERLAQFGVPVGYSGHERGIAISTVAAALGACIIERHITLDRTMRGPDHAASIEPQGIAKQVRDIRLMEQALGKRERPLARGEIINRHALRKSLVAVEDIPAGTVITREMLTARGPGSGVNPQRYPEVIGRPAPRNIRQGEQLREWDTTGITPDQVIAQFPGCWGLVVRYRDAERFAHWEPNLLEFHLTDQDLDNLPEQLGEFESELAVHAPEYYHGELLDLCSSDESVCQAGLSLVAKTCEVARQLVRHFPNQTEPVKVIVHAGGMSYEEPLADNSALIARLASSMEVLRREEGVELLLENLPPFPWYFGGQWYGNAFIDATEIADFCQTYGGRICFDLSHAFLSCNHTGADIIDFIKTVKPWIAHLHIADSSGTDGEALQIGTGETDFSAVMTELADVDAAIIPEIWFGHQRDGEPFLIALQRLSEFI